MMGMPKMLPPEMHIAIQKVAQQIWDKKLPTITKYMARR